MDKLAQEYQDWWTYVRASSFRLQLLITPAAASCQVRRSVGAVLRSGGQTRFISLSAARGHSQVSGQRRRHRFDGMCRRQGNSQTMFNNLGRSDLITGKGYQSREPRGHLRWTRRKNQFSVFSWKSQNWSSDNNIQVHGIQYCWNRPYKATLWKGIRDGLPCETYWRIRAWEP